MTGDRLLPQHNVVRYCKRRDLKWIGVPPVPAGVEEWAFSPRLDETDGLSVTWIEHFGTDRQKSLVEVRAKIGLRFKKAERLAVLLVGDIEMAGTGQKVSLHVIEEPEDPPGNPAHALVKDVGDLQDQKVREALASTVRDLESCF